MLDYNGQRDLEGYTVLLSRVFKCSHTYAHSVKVDKIGNSPSSARRGRSRKAGWKARLLTLPAVEPNAPTSGELGAIRSIANAARDAALLIVRQFLFWTMKDRARLIGDGAGHEFFRPNPGESERSWDPYDGP